MDEEIEPPPTEDELRRERAGMLKDRAGYIMLLTVSAVCAVISAVIGEYKALFLSLPALLLAGYALLKHGGVYVPMSISIILAVVLVLLMCTRWTFMYSSDLRWIDTTADFVMGMFLTLMGLILIYVLFRRMPGFDRENLGFVAVIAFGFGLSMSVLIIFFSFLADSARIGDIEYNQGFISSRELVSAMLGSFFMCLLYYANRNSAFFQRTIDDFLRGNADTIGIEEQEKESILRRIAGGENFQTEFKSTLRTNLHTGEKDPRMEKAVLKTIVAFLNSKGGTLLIGVGDDGSIVGVDEDSFESRDKMMLHLNNLIKSQIGSEYLPYITYKAVDFDSGCVIRVDCRPSESPCFLVEGKTETFFVRSGPSSIDLHGNDLLSYATHNFAKQLRKMYKPK
jgi:hypothetical protein